MSNKLKIIKLLLIICVLIYVLVLLETVWSDARHTKQALNAVGLLQTNKKGEDQNSKTYEPYTKRLNMKPEPNMSELQKLLSLELPNVPFEYWLRNEENKTFENTRSCTKYPTPLQLEFHNTYWQTLQLGSLRFRLYGAYLDNRPGLDQGPVVRILAMVNQQPDKSFPPNCCQLWYNNRNEAVIVPVSEYQPIWPKIWGYDDNFLYPIFLNCYLPDDDVVSDTTQLPQVVSIAPTACAVATNSLRIHYEELSYNEIPNPFVVCVKGFDFPYTDMSTRLVEWLELMRLLGADRIITYHLATHPNVRKVLEHYQETGLVEIRPITLASGEPGLPHFQHLKLQRSLKNKRYNELIPYNDCFYRSMYKYDYVVAVDIDEVIMPVGNYNSWYDLLEVTETLKTLNSEMCPLGFAGFCFNNVYFPNRPGNAIHSLEAPAYMHMLQHAYRYSRYSPKLYETKCFHGTSQVLMLHNHKPLKWMEGTCEPLHLDKQIAQLQHYKVSQKSYEGEPLMLDRNIWRFKKPLVERTNNVLEILGLI